MVWFLVMGSHGSLGFRGHRVHQVYKFYKVCWVHGGVGTGRRSMGFVGLVVFMRFMGSIIDV